MSIQSWLKNRLDNENVRNQFVTDNLAKLPAGSSILDAGCGSQRYRPFCAHLQYFAQDFGQYTQDEAESFTDGLGGGGGYAYGKLDYVGDIWKIDEADGRFDAVLCTEVLEHIPFPNETIHELARLLRPGGTLLLTAPSNCLRHMDPYFFYSGFSNRYFERMLADSGLTVSSITPIGDYYSWLAVEQARTMKNHGFLAKLLLAPALLWYMTRRKTAASVNTLCMGYHIVATKRA